MGVFDDKKFENLDWMSQMTETIESEVNSLLAKMPDRIKLDIDSVLSFMSSGYSSMRLSSDSVARHVLKCIPDRPKMSWEEEKTVQNCFELEISDEFTLDLETRTMTGEIHLVKVITTLDDELLQKHMGQEGIQQLSRVRHSDNFSMGRANEIIELLGGSQEALRGRSARRKIEAIRQKLMRIFSNNEWRIRDTTLANKVGKWVAEYIENGNLAAFSNFCKLKVMTHQNMPIYSIEEQE